MLVLGGSSCDRSIYCGAMPGGGTEESSNGGGSANAAGGSQSGGGLTPVAVEVGGLQPFQVKGDPHSISQRWRKWKKGFSVVRAG